MHGNLLTDRRRFNQAILAHCEGDPEAFPAIRAAIRPLLVEILEEHGTLIGDRRNDLQRYGLDVATVVPEAIADEWLELFEQRARFDPKLNPRAEFKTGETREELQEREERFLAKFDFSSHARRRIVEFAKSTTERRLIFAVQECARLRSEDLAHAERMLTSELLAVVVPQARAFVGGSEKEVEDFAHDIIISLFTKWRLGTATYDAFQGSLRLYLRQALRNKKVDRFRRQMREVAIEDTLLHAADTVANDGPQSWHDFLDDLNRIARDVLRPGEYQLEVDVLELISQGYSGQEIAKILEVSGSTVTRITARASARILERVQRLDPTRFDELIPFARIFSRKMKTVRYAMFLGFSVPSIIDEVERCSLHEEAKQLRATLESQGYFAGARPLARDLTLTIEGLRSNETNSAVSLYDAEAAEPWGTFLVEARLIRDIEILVGDALMNAGCFDEHRELLEAVRTNDLEAVNEALSRQDEAIALRESAACERDGLVRSAIESGLRAVRNFRTPERDRSAGRRGN